MNFYNEHDPFAAQWLRNLSDAGHIARGRVDARSIKELEFFDIPEGKQAHFFAGIGVWSRALRLAGWPDDVPVWTGSCPCQPFSHAGRRKGTADDRHLWPDWFRLIREHQPPVIFGEQVASPDGLKWFDIVSADLEGAGYTVGAADISAAGVGAPHIRQRLYFVAYAERNTGNARGVTSKPGEGSRTSQERTHAELGRRGDAGELGDADNTGPQGRRVGWDGPRQRASGAASLAGFWREAEWIYCRDKKWRAVEPGTFPLVDGAPSTVGQLRAYGNALTAQTAATFVTAATDALDLLALLGVG